jgi:hypothetical protein
MSSAALAAESAGDAAAGVKLTIDKTNALMKRSGTVKEFMELFFEDDLTITGEGETVTYKGLKSVENPLAAYLARQSQCKMTIIDPVRSSGSLAAAFIQEHCSPAKQGEKPDDWRILCVFRNGPNGWRVTMELFTSGVL